MAARNTKWISDSVTGCLPSRGYIEAATVMLTAALQDSSLTESFTYDLWPIAFLSSLTNGVPYSQPDSQIILFGRNLGEAPLSQAGRVGGTHCEWTRWASSSSLKCKTASGIGRVLVVGMTIESKYDATATACGAFTYDAIFVTRFGVHCNETTSTNTHCVEASSTSSNKPIAGGLSISVLGGGFGSEYYTSKIRLAGTTLASSTWISDSTVVCKIVTGQGSSVRAAVTNGASVSSVSEVFSYDSAHVAITLTWPRNRPSAHAGVLRMQHVQQTLLTIQGKNMGASSASAALSQGSSNCEHTRWKSDSSIHCMSTTGQRATMISALTLGQATGSSTEFLSYDIPSLRGTINNSHISPILADYLESLVDLNNRSNATANTSLGLVTVRVEHMEPTICNVNMSHSDACRLIGNFPSGSGTAVLLAGNSLGAQDGTVRSRIGGTSTQHTLWLSTSSILSGISSGISLQNRGTQGHLTSMAIVVTSGTMSGGSISEGFSFDLASVSTIWAQNAPMFVACQLLSERLQVLHHLAGSSFGPVDSSVLGVRTGVTACQASIWSSDTGITCLRPSGSWLSRSMIITSGVVGSSGSLTSGLSYNTVVLSAKMSKSLNSGTFGKGPILILLSGPNSLGRIAQLAGLGVYDSSLTMRLADSRSEETVWLSDSAAVSKSASGVGSALTLVISVAVGQVGTTTEVFSYNMHSVATLGSVESPSNMPKTGSVLKFLSGSPLTHHHPSCISATCTRLLSVSALHCTLIKTDKEFVF